MTKVATVNYTPEQEQALQARYLAGENVEALASAFNKSARSIIAKLVNLKVYKAKQYTTKQGENPVKKDQLADEIALYVTLSEADTESLTKANKSALKAIAEALASAYSDNPAFESDESVTNTKSDS